MEALTQLVSASLARHGLDRPVDPRRLRWSRWSRCDSPRSLLTVPSKPGIFAIAEDIMDVGTAAPGCQAESSSADAVSDSQKPAPHRRLLAVLQFSEDDDMAFTLDRIFARPNPMRDRLLSGSCFLRFVVVEDKSQRHSICQALNQWLIASAEKATGLPADFSSSLELSTANVGRAPQSDTASVGQALQPDTASVGPALLPANGDIATAPAGGDEVSAPSTPVHSGAASNLHCPQPFPSGF